jgi:hypothetical protein
MSCRHFAWAAERVDSGFNAPHERQGEHPMIHRVSTALAVVALLAAPPARAADPSLPHLVQKNGRHALIVDGRPFLILGAQCHNSSAWPAVLPKVWSAMEALDANTLEIPVYWEQFEPEPGRYDTSVVDAILAGAREHGLRLVLLWFATWKNGSNHYMPEWMKLQPEKYPNILGPTGEPIDSPSPHCEAALEADRRAFTELMRHLREADPQHTVIMVQVENEPGAWGAVRDHSKAAQALFEGPVPSKALAAMGVPEASGRSWTEAFGRDADEFFQVWHVARFIGQVAAAGKAVYPLPLYVNGALRDPVDPGWPPHYEVGGPNDNVFPLWKAAAPAVDILSPDIYIGDTDKYLRVLDLYARPDNPLFVPETIGFGALTRFLFAALGRGTIGYAPFGMDDTVARTGPDGAPLSPEEVYGPTALNYRMLRPMAREIARLGFEGKVKTAIQMKVDPAAERGDPVDRVHYVTDQTVHLDGWDADVAFGTFRRLARSERQPESPDGRILFAELGESRYLMAGYHCRVMFRPTGERASRPWQYLRVEEGTFVDGRFEASRILNGDQTDWGLVFAEPTVLRVALYSR